MLDKEGNILGSLTEAGKYLNEKGVTSAKYCYNTIADACKGRSKNGMAHGYKWRYHEEK